MSSNEIHENLRRDIVNFLAEVDRGSTKQIWCADCGALWWTPPDDKKGRWQSPKYPRAETTRLEADAKPKGK